ncbi:MAG: hypothetical protein ABW101_02335 [Candidatus Thiodiazotropha sp.]
MTPEQLKLVDKTLGILGYLSFLLAVVVVLIGAYEIGNKGYKRLLISLLDIDEAGIVFYPLLVAGIAFLWYRAYLRAGRNNRLP